MFWNYVYNLDAKDYFTKLQNLGAHVLQSHGISTRVNLAFSNDG